MFYTGKKFYTILTVIMVASVLKTVYWLSTKIVDFVSTFVFSNAAKIKQLFFQKFYVSIMVLVIKTESLFKQGS